MSIIYKSKLPNDFPNELFDLSKSLEKLGLSEIAWDFENTIKVIEFFSLNNYAILGGDVYLLSKGELESTYDSWYINKNVIRKWKEFVKESRDKAINYINQYHDRNGEDFYYSIVFEISGNKAF